MTSKTYENLALWLLTFSAGWIIVQALLQHSLDTHEILSFAGTAAIACAILTEAKIDPEEARRQKNQPKHK